MDKAHRDAQRASDREEKAENIGPEVLRTYAFILERYRGTLVSGTLQRSLPPEVYVAAIQALRFQADAMERGAEY